jgi:hypothetical protein
LSFDNDHDNEPALQGTAALLLGTEILVPHINEVLINAVNGIDKPELTCISEEEGIADMGYLPDNIFDGFDFNLNDDDDDDNDDVITSCNKVKYSLSEMENNASIPANLFDAKIRAKRANSTIRQNKNFLSLTSQVIPEISHESQDEERSVNNILSNGHHVDCNINKHLRNNENNFTAPTQSQATTKFPPVTNNRVISVIEEAAV